MVETACMQRSSRSSPMAAAIRDFQHYYWRGSASTTCPPLKLHHNLPLSRSFNAGAAGNLFTSPKLPSSSSCRSDFHYEAANTSSPAPTTCSAATTTKKKIKSFSSATSAVSRIRWAMSALLAGGRNRPEPTAGDTPPASVTGTIFGRRSVGGRAIVAIQADSLPAPAIVVELLGIPMGELVREMSSGPVRLALECERSCISAPERLLEEPYWRAYCNGRKCGYAVRRPCGEDDRRLLSSVEKVTTGAGVIPAGGGGGGGGVVFVRARFERVVGSRDSEAMYMINPDRHLLRRRHHGCHGYGGGIFELSLYLLRR